MSEQAVLDSAAVKAFLRGKGADVVGIAPIERFPADGSHRDPRVHFRRARTVIAFARRVAFSSATPYPSVASLQFGDFTLEAQLNELAYEASVWLEDAGAITMPMPAGRDLVSFEVKQEPPLEPRVAMAGSFDLRFAGLMAGLGVIGANGLLINPRFGSRIRLCAVLSSATLEPDQAAADAREIPAFCHECGFRCVKACPARALETPGAVDHYRCLTIRPDLVNSADALSALKRDMRGNSLVMAAKQLSYTTSPPHTCSTCTTLCPMDQGRALSPQPHLREGWTDDDFTQASPFPVKVHG